MKQLRSHPDLYLFEHIEQMRRAAKAMLNRHSRVLLSRCAELLEWTEDGITFHDAGKGSDPFQDYIPDPDHYRGNKQLKAHTPLSLLCVLAHGRERRWDWRQLLAVATLAAGHHSEFKTEQELRDVCGSDSMISVLKRQLDSFDWQALDHALGLRVTRIPPGDTLAIVAEADDQIEALFERLHESPDRLDYRLRCQLAFSVLLEADKAFLAISPTDVARYLDRGPVDLPPSLVDEHLADKPMTAANPLRFEARAALLERLASTEARIQTMTLPTGTGKTLLGATWALTHRQRLARDGSPSPKVLIVLPFLSIVDQTIKEYEKLLKSRVAAGDLVGYHSLSERTFDTELDAKSQEFFLDTWQSEVVITTFDQLLLAIFSPRAKHQLRFHNLADALIVLDEIQSLPCILWEPVRQALNGLAGLGTTHVLAMSATQPGFLSDAWELIPGPSEFFTRMRRYRLVLRHRAPLKLSEFIAECRSRLPQWKQRRVLITLNTRRSARQVFNALARKSRKLGLPVFFITGDKTPRDRLAAIDGIKAGSPCLVVSTQCVEAGVDVDMDLVIRDFSPLDSLVQIAGRCNRNGERALETVEIVSLVDDESSRPFAPMIYDPILLQETSRVLEGAESIDEDQVYGLTRSYFDLLRDKKNLGTAAVESWINWEETESIRRLLRGLQRPQTAFVVVDQDSELPGLLIAARDIADRWDRKRRFRDLAARIARLTVTVTPSIRSDFDPGDFADAFPEDASRDEAWFWLLHAGVYDPDGGLDVGDRKSDEPSWGMII
jgi:CRISPR-associated endonuclease/helicase Cas3